MECRPGTRVVALPTDLTRALPKHRQATDPAYLNPSRLPIEGGKPAYSRTCHCWSGTLTFFLTAPVKWLCCSHSERVSET